MGANYFKIPMVLIWEFDESISTTWPQGNVFKTPQQHQIYK
ncbi:hypothetical protein FVER14953_21237 [Fusarium verticillioides]|nr:hypothetical protein FVER14953_21237 [Fusarium verticillioides]